MASERPSLTDAQIDAILRATGELLDVPPMSDAAARARAHIELRASWGQKGQGRGMVIPFPAGSTDVDATTGAQGGHLGEERGSRLRELALLAAGLAAAAVLAVVLTLVFRGFDGGSDDDRSGVAGGPLAAEPYDIPGYEFVRAIGRPQVPNEPVDVAIGPDGTLFVLDAAYDRVIAFTPDGEIETDWGDEGFSTQIPGAHALGAGPNGDVYVAADHVYVIDASGRQTASWPFPDTADEETRYLRSHGLVVDSAGNVYVAGRSVIWKFESGTGSASTIELDIELDAGQDFQLAIDIQDRLYIAGISGSVLRVGADGTTSLVGQARRLGDINGFAVASDGSFVLFQSGSGGVKEATFIKLDDQGAEIASWPADRTGFFIGNFGPIWFGIEVTADGTIVLPDPMAHRLALYGADGTFAGEIRDDRPEAFGRLWHIGVDGESNVLGYDPSLDGKVLKFSLDGELLQSVTLDDNPLRAMETEFQSSGFTATTDGGFIIADQTRNQVFRYSPSGELAQEWEVDLTSESGVAFPHAVVTDEHGFLYIVDEGVAGRLTGNLRKFTLDGEFVGEVGSISTYRVDLAYHDGAIWGIDDGAIVRFPSDGGEPQTFATPADSDEGGVLPGSALTLALDSDGNIYTYLLAADSEQAAFAGALAKLDPQGNLLWTVELAPVGISRYVDLAIAPDGTLYLADSELRQILAYRPTGEPEDVATAEPTATVEPESTYVPTGEVPDLLVVERVGDADRPTQIGVYDPASGDLVELPPGELVGISPDGGMLLLIDREPGEEWLRLDLIAVSTETLEEMWRTDIGELAEVWPNTIYFDTSIAGGNVYVALHDPDFRGEMLQVAEVRLSDGFMRPRSASGLDTDVSELTDPSVEVDLLASPPDGAAEMMYLIRAPEEDRTAIQTVSGVGYSHRLRELVPLQPGERYVLPGGDGLFNVPHSGYTTDPAIEYVMFEDVTAGRIELPFELVEAGGGTIVEYAVSHDGRILYALSPYQPEIAVVDLEQLELVEFSTLDGAPLNRLSGDVDMESVASLYRRHPMTVSPDGRYIYALGLLHDRAVSYTPSIWKIDMSTWAVVDEFVPADGQGVPLSLHTNHDGSRLYVGLGLSPPAFNEDGALETGEPGMLILDTETFGESGGSTDLNGSTVVGTLADVYRGFHGRSPAVDGVAPG